MECNRAILFAQPTTAHQNVNSWTRIRLKTSSWDVVMAPSNRLPEIDRLRGIAILVTLYSHFHVLIPWPTNLPLIEFSRGGVYLFFVFSGFVIARSLVPMLLAEKNAPSKLWQAVFRFYFRRVFRIVLPSWIWLGVFCVFSFFLGGAGFPHFDETLKQSAIGVLKFQANFDYFLPRGFSMPWYWSLAVEEQVYFLLPLIVCISIYTGFIRTLFVTAIAITAISLVYFESFKTDTGLFPYSGINFLPHVFILIGCWIWAHKSSNIRSQIPKNVWLRNVVAVVILFLLFMADEWAYRLLPNKVSATWFQIFYHLYMLTFTIPLGLMAADDTRSLFNLPILAQALEWLGRRSLGLYLSHIICFVLAKILLRSFTEMAGIEFDSRLTFPLVTLGLLMSLFVGEVSYRYIELPLTRIGYKLSGGDTTKAHL